MPSIARALTLLSQVEDLAKASKHDPNKIDDTKLALREAIKVAGLQDLADLACGPEGKYSDWAEDVADFVHKAHKRLLKEGAVVAVTDIAVAAVRIADKGKKVRKVEKNVALDQTGQTFDSLWDRDNAPVRVGVDENKRAFVARITAETNGVFHGLENPTEEQTKLKQAIDDLLPEPPDFDDLDDAHRAKIVNLLAKLKASTR